MTHQISLADQAARDAGPPAYDLQLWDQTNARPATASLVLSWRQGVPMRVSDLIRERVSLEWHRRDNPANPAVRPLVELAAAGMRTAPDERFPACASLEEVVAVALGGFLRNAFFVIVDDLQVTDLDAEIRLKPSTQITFIRLLPLVGG